MPPVCTRAAARTECRREAKTGRSSPAAPEPGLTFTEGRMVAWSSGLCSVRSRLYSYSCSRGRCSLCAADFTASTRR
eukprot:6662985-Alexandrium_andersonii.AAC.1